MGIEARCRETLKRFNLKPNKSLGQNFLINEPAVKSIIDAANLRGDDTVLEIGSGTGIVTRELAARVQHVIACEFDRGLMTALQDELKEFSNIRYIHADILSVDIKALIAAEKLKVVANLPYCITTPIITKLLEVKGIISLIILMVQQEVAARILSKPGTKEYGSFSIFVNYHSRVERVRHVSRGCFFPQPQVDSDILRLYPLGAPPVSVRDEVLFFQLSRAAFGQRRKTLRNALFTILGEKAGMILQGAGIDPSRRGETLSLEEFATLTNRF
ncbi:16S rRNA (adenine(1518)-N(6)/adenine(1519)-N(6))-dimethyltransferase RsmA [bacterium]|nr:16S rRNA (adenine(1518)-N(6)/adenine(1519)-N(6))-dimethyltransferase RsmA [bacterium]MBU1753739.1 16S rRNA (adenine(1518)-N(6)/adenine(1519)-N(6))-dimethyltransferase RsmA [bacterium]